MRAEGVHPPTGGARASRYTSTETASRSGLETAPRQRRRDPRRRPAAAAADRTARRCGRDRGPRRCAASSCPRPRTVADETRARRAPVRGAAQRSRCPPRTCSRGDRGARAARVRSTGHRSRRGRTPRGRALDLELRIPAPPALEQHPRDGAQKAPYLPGERRRIAPETVEPSHGLTVEADAGGEAEASPLTRAECDPARAPGRERRRRLRAPHRSDRAAARARAAGRSSRRPAGSRTARAVGAVQRLVVGAVAGEDEDRVRVAGDSRASSVACPARWVNTVRSSTRSRRRELDGADALAGHLRRVRIDDQDRPLHPGEHAMCDLGRETTGFPPKALPSGIAAA